VREKTLLIMGDSVTVGVGVPADATFPALLDRHQVSHRVINAAVNGYGLHDYIGRLRDLLPQWRPDGVVLGLCLNDLESTSAMDIRSQIEHKSPTWDDYALRYPNLTVRILRYSDDHYLHINRYLNHYWLTSIWIKNILTDSPKNYFLAEYASYERPEAINQARAGFRKSKLSRGKMAPGYSWPSFRMSISCISTQCIFRLRGTG